MVDTQSPGTQNLQKLQDLLSRKEQLTIEVDGTCDNSGILIQRLNRSVKLNESVSHKIALVTLESVSFFPNIDTTNNRFYYSAEDNVVKTVTMPTGALEIGDDQDAKGSYNQRIKQALAKNNHTPDNITLTLDSSTAETRIELKGAYKVYFNKDRTWRDSLGFDARDLTANGIHVSDRMANILPCQKIYVGCDLCKGSLVNADKVLRSNILFSFPNNKAFGAPLAICPSPLRPSELSKKEFDCVRLEFFSDDNKPINFLGRQVTAEISIWQS
jgi:hypothetical protein